MQWLVAHAAQLWTWFTITGLPVVLAFATIVHTMSDEEKERVPPWLLFIARIASWRNGDGSWSVPGWPSKPTPRPPADGGQR